MPPFIWSQTILLVVSILVVSILVVAALAAAPAHAFRLFQDNMRCSWQTTQGHRCTHPALHHGPHRLMARLDLPGASQGNLHDLCLWRSRMRQPDTCPEAVAMMDELRAEFRHSIAKHFDSDTRLDLERLLQQVEHYHCLETRQRIQLRQQWADDLASTVDPP